MSGLSWTTNRISLRQVLTNISTLEQLPERFIGSSHTALDDRLLPLELALTQPLRELRQRRAVLLRKVEDDKALHPEETG